MRSGQVALPEGFGYWLVKFDGLEGNGDKEGGLFIFFERHPVPDALSFFGSARVAYERNAYDIWWEIVAEKDKRFGGFAIYIPQARCYNTGVLKNGYYLRYYRYGEKGAKRAFNVLSLGYNRCMAKLDYTRFLCRHPSKHRFSESNGRTLNSYYGTRQKGQ